MTLHYIFFFTFDDPGFYCKKLYSQVINKYFYAIKFLQKKTKWRRNDYIF